MKTTPLAKEQKQRREARTKKAFENGFAHLEELFQDQVAAIRREINSLTPEEVSERVLETRQRDLKRDIEGYDFIKQLDTAQDRAEGRDYWFKTEYY